MTILKMCVNGVTLALWHCVGSALAPECSIPRYLLLLHPNNAANHGPSYPQNTEVSAPMACSLPQELKTDQLSA